MICLSSSGQWELQGLLSQPGECNSNKQRPAVFTSINSEIVGDWIRKSVGELWTSSQND